MKLKHYKKKFNQNIEQIDVFDSIKDYAYNKQYDYVQSKPKRSFSFRLVSSFCITFVSSLVIISIGLFVLNKTGFGFNKESTDPNESPIDSEEVKPNNPSSDFEKEDDENNNSSMIVDKVYEKYQEHIILKGSSGVKEDAVNINNELTKDDVLNIYKAYNNEESYDTICSSSTFASANFGDIKFVLDVIEEIVNEENIENNDDK